MLELFPAAPFVLYMTALNAASTENFRTQQGRNVPARFGNDDAQDEVKRYRLGYFCVLANIAHIV